ncbi:MAG: peptidase [Oceanicaulis sp.]|uniref:PepSY-associated TM helix domain-containing protein n=1 Tax=Oceanicaulis sp. TaxID=1924941 RepID=UPI000C4B9345|nr:MULTISPECIES: PepSY-associated TM helix domain-containing protein [unclassified Oceanicaulis]MAB69432.1 peptidase [Oceanicaulis sp.]MBC39060.1 peptidase [Oceanicaulis sp.]MBG37023.1 peptidase [Oceanicaulis sp.]HBU62328.1 peptidase [Oceanicaulis sp.]|tara:strand:+ start:1631 stop:3148 length:1518 start_codon:yes stop_codon:yes gene_type:complete
MAAPARPSIWPDLSAKLVARMLSAHAGLGVILGALLYIVSLSGVLVVFHAEFARWEQPHIVERQSVSPELAQSAAQSVLDHARAMDDTPDEIMIFMPTPDSPRLAGGYDDSYWFIDDQARLGERIDHGFSEFLIDLHYYLHLPSTLGLIVVGLMGVMMLALVVSGFLAHPRVFRDAFRSRKPGNGQLSLADRHNRLSVWGAPFHVMIPLTGAALGLATIVALVLAQSEPEMTVTDMFDTVFGAGAEQTAPAGPLPDAAQALRVVAKDFAEDGLIPWIIQIHHPGEDEQTLQILTAAPDRLIFGEYLQFSPDGRFIGQTGLENGEFGQQAMASVYNLHFGNWGGVPVKLVYVVLGLALCVVCVSGVQLWLYKRARKKGPQPRLERAWIALVWGPVALIGLCLTLDRVFGIADSLLAPVFWIGLVALAGLSQFAPSKAGLSCGLKLTGATLLLIGASAHFLAYGASGYQNPAAWGVFAGIILSALLLTGDALRQPRAEAMPAVVPGD